jgi:hypothetical protein
LRFEILTFKVMDQHEEDLQGKIARGETVQADIDVKAYRVVFHALKKEPVAMLSSSFEDRIIQLVVEKRMREERRDKFWFGFGLFMIFIAFVVAIALTGFAWNLGFLRNMSDYSGVAIFGVAFIAFLNWLDKKIGITPTHF